MIRLYRQPRYGYWVLAVGKASLRIGRGTSDRCFSMIYSSRDHREWYQTKARFIALWILGLFMQLDWNINDGGLR